MTSDHYLQKDTFGLRVPTLPIRWYGILTFIFLIARVILISLSSLLKVDKLFNPLTLLVGPCLVAVVVYKSTIPVDEGGYHLPWW